MSLRDGIVLTGLLAFGWGLYGIDWRAAAIGLGCVLLYLGLIFPRRR